MLSGAGVVLAAAAQTLAVTCPEVLIAGQCAVGAPSWGDRFCAVPVRLQGGSAVRAIHCAQLGVRVCDGSHGQPRGFRPTARHVDCGDVSLLPKRPIGAEPLWHHHVLSSNLTLFCFGIRFLQDGVTMHVACALSVRRGRKRERERRLVSDVIDVYVAVLTSPYVCMIIIGKINCFKTPKGFWFLSDRVRAPSSINDFGAKPLPIFSKNRAKPWPIFSPVILSYPLSWPPCFIHCDFGNLFVPRLVQ